MGLQALSDAVSFPSPRPSPVPPPPLAPSNQAARQVFTPANIPFEVLYLDRSEGGEVTRHEGGKGMGTDEGTVRLLYRPGHYDLLYRAEDVRERGGGGVGAGAGAGVV